MLDDSGETCSDIADLVPAKIIPKIKNSAKPANWIHGPSTGLSQIIAVSVLHNFSRLMAECLLRSLASDNTICAREGLEARIA